MIDLRKAKVGDLFKRRDGRTVCYQGSRDSMIYRHYLADEAYTDDGAYLVDEPAHTLDIVAKYRAAALRSLESLHEQTMKVAVASNTKKAIKIAAYEDVLRELKHYLTTSGCYESRKRELVNKIDKAMEAK
jgi:hypothetical protein